MCACWYRQSDGYDKRSGHLFAFFKLSHIMSSNVLTCCLKHIKKRKVTLGTMGTNMTSKNALSSLTWFPDYGLRGPDKLKSAQS